MDKKENDVQNSDNTTNTEKSINKDNNNQSYSLSKSVNEQSTRVSSLSRTISRESSGDENFLCASTFSAPNNDVNKSLIITSTNLVFPKIMNPEGKRIGEYYFIMRNIKENNRNTKDNWKQIYFLIIIIEKSIFYFNQKKYKECFDLLIKENIIKDNIELGVFLLVVEGFDKDIICDFLSSNIFPNENKEILDTFLNCINMDFHNNNSVLICLRCLVSLLNSPKKEIVDKFSEIFFMTNKNNETFIKIYKNLNIFSSFVYSIILINNIFIGKDKNNTIKMDKFVKMNKDIEKKLCQNIYKFIQSHQFFSLDSYLQKMYKKLSFLAKEYDENEKLNKSSDIDYFYENILNDNPKRDYENKNIWFSYRRNLSNFTKEDEEILLKPTLFTKYVSNSTTSHPRVFVFRDNFTNLIWAKSIEGEKIKGNLHTLKIEDINDIYLGFDYCDVLKKYLKSNLKEMGEEYSYITIKTKTEIYAIKAENSDVSLRWYKAIKSLLLKYQSGKIKDKERIIENNINGIENGIMKIWKNCIYNKWSEYGQYLFYNKQNKLQYKKVINQKNKTEKVFKSDLIDDKINFNTKKIVAFMSAIKYKISEIGIDNLILDYNEFLFLYNIGLPHQCRPIIWECLIDNPCGITREIYDYYSMKNEEYDVNFEEIIKKYEENNCNNNLLFNNNSEINTMIIDIIKTRDLFINELYLLNIGKNEILSKIFKLVNIFFLMRKDISYDKNIINFVFIFVLVFKDEFISFKNLYNFICSSNILNYFIKEDDISGKCCSLPFDSLLQQHIPRIYLHFRHLNITSELYTFFWYKNLFTCTLNYRIILRVLDRYLIYGEEVLVQTGLTIIKLQEEDLLNYTVNEIFKVLRRLPNKYDEELFFENLELMNKVQINDTIIKESIETQRNMLS